MAKVNTKAPTADETPEQKIARLEKENAELRDLNAQLQKELATVPDSKKEVIVECDGKKYLATMPTFKYNKIVYKKTDLLEKPDLVKELIKIEFGGLQEVVEETEEETE